MSKSWTWRELKDGTREIAIRTNAGVVGNRWLASELVNWSGEGSNPVNLADWAKAILNGLWDLRHAHGAEGEPTLMELVDAHFQANWKSGIPTRPDVDYEKTAFNVGQRLVDAGLWHDDGKGGLKPGPKPEPVRVELGGVLWERLPDGHWDAPNDDERWTARESDLGLALARIALFQAEAGK